MYNIEYAALKYYNSPISDECLYIGILFINQTTGERFFKYISNFSRFRSFDDEANIDFVKAYLRGIKEEVENNLFNKELDIKEYIRFFANEFRFSQIKKIDIEETIDYVESISKLYLKYDYSKEKRLSHDSEKKLMRAILKSNNVKYSSKPLSGIYNENISFDYIIDNTLIKLISLKEKKLKRLIPVAKQWAFTANELKKEYSVIFILDELADIEDKTTANIICTILKEYARVFSINDGIDHILHRTA